MRILRSVLGLGVLGLVGTSLALAAGTEGCISSAPTGPVVDSGGLPGFDSALPPFPGAEAGVDATMPPPSGDAGGMDSNVPPVDSGPDTAVPTAQVRFGWFDDREGLGIIGPSAGKPLPPGYDVCIAQHGTQSWTGPLLAGAGLATGLPPLAVSKYFTVPAGAYDVLLLPPGHTTTCAPFDAGAEAGTDDAGNPIFSSVLVTSLPPVPAGVALTIGVVDSATDPSGLGVVALVDEPTAPAGKVNARFASVAPAVGQASALSLGGGVASQPFFATGAAAVLDPTADPKGYRVIDPISAIDLSLSIGPNAMASLPLALTAGSVVSVFEGENVTDGYAPVLIVCFDGQPSAGSAALTNCVANDFNTNRGAYSYTRFADFIADTPAPIDVCLRYQGTTPFSGPLLAASVAGADAGADAGPIGLSPPNDQSLPQSLAVSGYFNVHSGFSYDVRLVPAGGTCATALTGIADFVYAAPSGPGGQSANATFAATGFVNVPGDAGEPTAYDAGPIDAGPDASQESPGLSSVALNYVALTDESYSASAGGSVRIVHLAARVPQPFNVLAYGPMGQAFPPVWTVVDMPYGGFGSDVPGVDGNGYQAVTSSGTPIYINNTIGGANEVELYTGTLSANATDTLFVYFYTNPLGFTGIAFLECPDSTFQAGGLYPCTFGNGG
jgi:hypothetical protein